MTTKSESRYLSLIVLKNNLILHKKYCVCMKKLLQRDKCSSILEQNDIVVSNAAHQWTLQMRSADQLIGLIGGQQNYDVPSLSGRPWSLGSISADSVIWFYSWSSSSSGSPTPGFARWQQVTTTLNFVAELDGKVPATVLIIDGLIAARDGWPIAAIEEWWGISYLFDSVLNHVSL